MTDELVVSVDGGLGLIQLNRPKALNSLTLDMVRAFDHALQSFVDDARIVAVLVRGAGERGLCAGGDIRLLYESRAEGGDHYKRFWREEYRLNARIAAFPKPYVVIMDGLVMGGGVGISAHGNRRIVTERTRLAMPEAAIGFIPDVGGTWLLTRKGAPGIYMALSGATVGPADAIHAGLADMMMDSANAPELARTLSAARSIADVDCILAEHALLQGEAPIAAHETLLRRAVRHETVEEIIAALEAEDSIFARTAAKEIARNSPLSLKATHALLKRAELADRLEICLVNEFRAACQLLKSHDLYEGIRAAVIDKDKRPRWSPATLANVSDAMVAAILEGTVDPDPTFTPWAAS